MIHYEVEVFERHAWRPLTDRKGKTAKFTTAESAWEEKERLPNAQVVQVLNKRTIIHNLAMMQCGSNSQV